MPFFYKNKTIRVVHQYQSITREPHPYVSLALLDPVCIYAAQGICRVTSSSYLSCPIQTCIHVLGKDNFLQLVGGTCRVHVTSNLFLLYPMYVFENYGVQQLVNQLLPQVQLLVGPLGLACVAVLPVKISHLLHPSETSGDDTLLHSRQNLPAVGADRCSSRLCCRMSLSLRMAPSRWGPISCAIACMAAPVPVVVLAVVICIRGGGGAAVVVFRQDRQDRQGLRLILRLRLSSPDHGSFG